MRSFDSACHRANAQSDCSGASMAQLWGWANIRSTRGWGARRERLRAVHRTYWTAAATHLHRHACRLTAKSGTAGSLAAEAQPRGAPHSESFGDTHQASPCWRSPHTARQRPGSHTADSIPCRGQTCGGECWLSRRGTSHAAALPAAFNGPGISWTCPDLLFSRRHTRSTEDARSPRAAVASFEIKSNAR